MNRKLTLALFLGLVTSIALTFTLEFVGHLLFPIDMDKMNALIKSGTYEDLKLFMDGMPIGAFISVILAHGLGLLGGLIVCRIMYNEHRLPLYGLAIIILLSTMLNLMLIPHPTWFPYADISFSLGLAAIYIYSRKKT